MNHFVSQARRRLFGLCVFDMARPKGRRTTSKGIFADKGNSLKARRCLNRPKNRSASKKSASQTKHKFQNSTPTKEKAGESPKYSLIACGSFNPITNMHLRMFEVAKNSMELVVEGCKITRGIISPVSDGYGKQGLERATHRVKMCTLAVESNPWLEVSELESKQETWTPTLKVLENVQKELQAKKDPSQLMLLCGSDFLESFNTPGLWKDSDVRTIVKRFGIVVIKRPGFNPEKVVSGNKILCELKEKIHVAEDHISNDTSSTSIRHALLKKESIKYLTQDNVIDYILENNLYATEESARKNADKTLAPYDVNSS